MCSYVLPPTVQHTRSLVHEHDQPDAWLRDADGEHDADISIDGAPVLLVA